MIQVNGVNIPHLVSEMTLKEYEFVSVILNNKNLDSIDKYVKIFKHFGVTEEYLNALDFNEFKELIKSFNESKPDTLEFKKELEIDGYVYRAFDDEFKVLVKDMKEIEKAFKNERYICQLMAIIFKRTDLNDKEHYSREHIKYKAKLLGELKADFCLPYLVAIGNIFKEQYEQTNKLEASQDTTIS